MDVMAGINKLKAMTHLPASSVMFALLGRKIRSYITGGYVRDVFFGLEPKDIDVEVYGCNYERLVEVLKLFGEPDIVGKSFGVAKLYGVDYSIPRRESKTGVGHKYFMCEFDPDISPAEGSLRRDFTINSLMYDPINGELLDHHGGLQDIQCKVLRCTNRNAFAEDPLRVLRGMQFACRFDLSLDGSTAGLCWESAKEVRSMSVDRIREEWLKWALKSTVPSRLTGYITQTGLWQLYPNIYCLTSVPQDPDHHPEGNVGVHTGHVLDEAVKIADRDGLEGDDRAVLVFAALCHDMGKLYTTTTIDGKLCAHGHHHASEWAARGFLESIGLTKLADRVVPLVREHMICTSYTQVSRRTVNRLSHRLAPATIAELYRLIQADSAGRPPKPKAVPQVMVDIMEISTSTGVVNDQPAPIIQGRDLVVGGLKPGPVFRPILAAAMEAQLDGVFTTHDEGLEWLWPYILRHYPKEVGDVIDSGAGAAVAGAQSGAADTGRAEGTDPEATSRCGDQDRVCGVGER